MQGCGLPRWCSGKEPACQYRRHRRCGLDPWVQISWRRKWQPMNAMVWWFEHSLVLPLWWIGMRNDLFQSCGPCWAFQICWHIECSTLIASSFRILNSSAEIPSPPLASLAEVFLKAHLTSQNVWLWMSDYTIMAIWIIKVLFCTILLCILSISSWSFLLLLCLYHFCPLLCPS